MQTETYNGWTNYGTWNVNLWVENDEGVYLAKIEMLQKRRYPVGPETVRAFYHREMGGTTPDLDEMRRTRERFGRINFGEIAGHWEAERLEMREAF